jgi:flagellar hook-length control protein FliK
MTVSISPTPAAKTASPETAAPAKGQDAKFGKLIDAVEVGAAADTPLEPQAVPDTKPADQSLEALLSALKLSLTPGTGLLTPSGKKASTSDKDAAAKDKPAKDGEKEYPAGALLAALNISTMPTPAVAKTLAGQVSQAVDDVLSKASSPAPVLTSLGDATPAPAPVPLPADLVALVDASVVKTPAEPSLVTAQLDRLVDTARDAAWLDRLSQDIAASAGAGDKMRFRMMPPNLGTLDVSVERQAAGMSVTMTTHTTDARNLIADSRQQMIDSLKAQGVPLVQLSLSTAGEEQAGHRPPTFFNHLIEAAPLSGTDLAAQPVESTTAERVGRFA